MIALWLATGFGVGRSRWAPGTLGTLLGLPLAWGCGLLPPLGQLAAIGLLVGLGVPICTKAAAQLGKKDPGAVVWDEIATVPITFFMIALDGPIVVLLGFLLHRLFDISKAPPARQVERWPAGWGIMADDCVAGVYSNLALRGLLALFAWQGWSV